MKQDKDIISYDFQGWPNYKMNLREILIELGATTENGMMGFKEDDSVLDIYPEIMEDDGMAYGVNERYVTETNVDKEKTFINIFAEPKTENEEPSPLQQMQELRELFHDQIEALKKEEQND